MTDFGDVDPFVGVMKGVIKSLAPYADIIDLTHGVSVQDIREGSFLWSISAPFFPAGTIHVGVVDPGVGTSRLPIAVRFGKQTFICPDNGLMTYLLDGAKPDAAHVISDPQWMLPGVSRTFHGRDIFAPAAAHLANGVGIEQLGPSINDLMRLPLRRPSVEETRIVGEIVRFDRFGNAWTNIPENAVTLSHDGWTVRAGAQPIGGIVSSYGAVPHGAPLVIFASHGYLEIAVAGGDARTALGLSVGDEVIMERGE